MSRLQYVVYNTILRKYPEDFYSQLLQTNNSYPTTLFVLTSAIQKLSRVTKIQSGMVLYRGLSSDVSLPDLFYEHDARGCTGFTEWGFMSTTSRKEVALEYSKMGEGGPQMKLLAISVGSVDRGAYIGEFSQYQAEEEYLFVPCSFVEKIASPSIDVSETALLELIPVKVNANLKAKTVDELMAQKRDMHIAAFSHHIELLNRRLCKIAKKRKAEERLRRDTSLDASKNHTAGGFIDRIVDQCREVLSRHKAVNNQDFNNDDLFRSLVFEMIEVQSMAISKLKEWLENEDSYLRFRWNAPLRSVHRRWTVFLDDRRMASDATAESKLKDSIRICRAMGLIGRSVDEKNELGETRIMCAAAEGKRGRLLRLLVDARASVDQARPDGVTPMWLAAESGHAHCIKSLARLNASVSEASNSKATPIFIAARNGRTECVKALAELKADVNIVGSHRSYPVHQAAIYGHTNTLRELVRLKADINVLDGNSNTAWYLADRSGHSKCAQLISTELNGSNGTGEPTTPMSRKNNLVISTGDISDADGFLALAEYAKTGADVLFIMNYPAYVGVDKVDPQYADKNLGLGYMYSAKEVLDRDLASAPPSYIEFLSSYGENVRPNKLMKCALTDMTFALANNVWNEVQAHGNLMFGIGGINSVNPFSETAIKNEVLVYSGLVSPSEKKLKTDQGIVYNSDGQETSLDFSEYRDIFIDFNGSMAFWNGFLANALSAAKVVSKIRGVFVMGGVYADKEPVTMPPIPHVLNRFSSATMNQLYHPQNAADFFAFLAQFNIPTWTVSNNIVADLTTWKSLENDQNEKTFEGVDQFLSANNLQGVFLRKLAEAHYNSRYDPPRKPFDFYCAFALTSCMQLFKKLYKQASFKMNPFLSDISSQTAAASAETASADGNGIIQNAARQFQPQIPRTLFYSNVYGTTFISPFKTWDKTVAAYAQVIDTDIRPDDTDFEKNKKAYFKKELEVMQAVGYLGSLDVSDLRFHLDEARRNSLEAAKRLSLASDDC